LNQNRLQASPESAIKDLHFCETRSAAPRRPFCLAAFLFGLAGEVARVVQDIVQDIQPKNFSAVIGTSSRECYGAAAGWWTTNMRNLALGLVFSAVAVTVSLPCFAQTILKSEPLVLAPYEVAFVQDASCSVGKVLKVTGAIRGLHRRKACVTVSAEQASLAVATP
jgi:hypothetical protein